MTFNYIKHKNNLGPTDFYIEIKCTIYLIDLTSIETTDFYIERKGITLLINLGSKETNWLLHRTKMHKLFNRV